MPPPYNLVRQPWLPAVTRDGEFVKLSLIETFRRAPSLRCIEAETATMTAALYRELLAILRRATAADRDAVEAKVQWVEWFADWTPVAQHVTAYLEGYEHRFNLTDDKMPFRQVPSLQTASGKTSGIERLLPDAGAYFSTRVDDAPVLTPEEAARALVWSSHYDPSGIKTGAVGDPRVKGGKGYPIGLPPTAALGLILVEGATLHETLLLNLNLGADYPEDSCLWEREPVGPGPCLTHSIPKGPADLLTWPSRRFRLLFNDDGNVVDAMVCNGDAIDMRNRRNLEFMTVWRHSPTQSKNGQDVFFPKTHDPNRALWRGAESLLARGSELLPGNLEWLADLVVTGHLPRDYRFTIRAIGLWYGTQNSVVVAEVDDRLIIPAPALVSPQLERAAVDAVETARTLVGAMTTLADRLAVAGGTSTEVAREKTAARMWAGYDQPYREWLVTLTDPERVAEYTADWHRRVRRAAFQLGRQLGIEAGRRASIGRVVDDQLRDTASAWAAFCHRVWQLTPLAVTPTDEDTTIPTNSTEGAEGGTNTES